MQDYLPLSSQQLETIHQSAKGIISRIPRGLEKLKCVRITHEANSEELHVWATDRYCVIHLVLYTALYAGLRHPGVLDIRFHSFSDGEVIE